MRGAPWVVGLALALGACAFDATPIEPGRDKVLPRADAEASQPDGAVPQDSGQGSTGLTDGSTSAFDGGVTEMDATLPEDAGPVVIDGGPRADAAVLLDASAAPEDAGTAADAGDGGSDVSDAGDAGRDASDAGDAGRDASPVCDAEPCRCPHETMESTTCSPSLCELSACAPAANCRYESSQLGRYYVCDDELTWQQAKDQCESRTGLRLAAVESEEEDDFLFSLLSDKTWVGGNDMMQEGSWRWLDGTAFYEASGSMPGPVDSAYVNWDIVEPNNLGLGGGQGDCMILWSDNLDWADASCSDLHGFVCEVVEPTM